MHTAIRLNYTAQHPFTLVDTGIRSALEEDKGLIEAGLKHFDDLLRAALLKALELSSHVWDVKDF